VLHVDPVLGRVTLQAGARLEVALAALRAAGWTLQNFSSIKEQQVGGWTQAGCHGTGATLPPVEETVVALKLVTPAKGTLLLSDAADNNRELFHLAKLGLGALGVVVEVTLQVRRDAAARRAGQQLGRRCS
jgi:L-galactono-1,4-lactone dehydrogenase